MKSERKTGTNQKAARNVRNECENNDAGKKSFKGRGKSDTLVRKLRQGYEI